MLVIFLFSCSVVAGEPQSYQLTLADAIEKAVERSKVLKIAEMEKEKAAELREDAQKDVGYIPSGFSSPEADAAYAGLVQAELNYQIKSKDIKEIEEDIKRLVIEKYSNVLRSQADLASARKGLAYAEWNLAASEIKSKVGVMSPSHLVAVKASNTAAHSALIQAEEDLAHCFEELNILVGLSSNERPELTSTIRYPAVEVESVDTEVNRVIAHSQTVWKALQLVVIEEQDLDIISKLSPPYEVSRLEIGIAELNADQAKEELKKQLLALYHNICILEGGIEAATQSVTAAEEALRVAEIRHDLGLASKGEVLEAEANLAAACSKLNQVQCNHTSAVASFNKITGRPVWLEELDMEE